MNVKVIFFFLVKWLKQSLDIDHDFYDIGIFKCYFYENLFSLCGVTNMHKLLLHVWKVCITYV